MSVAVQHNFMSMMCAQINWMSMMMSGKVSLSSKLAWTRLT